MLDSRDDLFQVKGFQTHFFGQSAAAIAYCLYLPLIELFQRMSQRSSNVAIIIAIIRCLEFNAQ